MKSNRSVAILGSTGMLGQALMEVSRSFGLEVFGASLNSKDGCSLDIRDVDALERFVILKRPDVVINTCAIVNLQACEDDPLNAYLTNARPNAILSKLSRQFGFKLVYISTDGYFENDANFKHDERHEVKLLNEYARTKYAGECFAMSDPRALVLRTNIVGFRHDAAHPTFVEWAIDSILRDDHLTLFNDYFTSSIDVKTFSRELLSLISNDVCGLLNLSSHDVFSKAEFINGLAKRLNVELNNAVVGSVSQNLRPARANSLGLDVSKAEDILGHQLPSLDDVLDNLHREYNNDL